MRSNRGLSEFASFPLLLIIALVFIIISLLMFVAEFRNQTADVDAGMQAALVGLLHAERDQVEMYLGTALDRSVRDGIARAYAYRSAACPLSEHGLPILSDSCGYDRLSFVSASESFASERFANVTALHPTAVLRNTSVTIDLVDEHARGGVDAALVYHETGSGSRVYDISRDLDPRMLPIFLGPLESFDETPDTIDAEPTFEINDETPAYCDDDPMSKEKAATFVKNTIGYCERQSGTCSCGSVTLPGAVRPDVREDGVYLYDYPLGITGVDLEDAPRWRFWTDSSPVEQFYVHRDESGVVLNATDPGLATCSQSTGRVAIVPLSEDFPVFADSAQIPFDVLSADEDANVVSSYDIVVFLAPNLTSDPRGTISYYGDESLTTLHNVALRADPDVYGSPETFDGPRDEFEEPLTSCDEPFLVSTERTSVHLGAGDPAVGGALAQYGIDESKTKVLYVRYPTQTAAACGSEPMTPGTDAYQTLMEGIIEASQRAIESSSTPPRTRIACIDDPIKEWVELDGSQQYLDVYPTVAVPIDPDFIWPIENIGRFTQCWGPATEDTRIYYDFHRGIDLQPDPYDERLYWGTEFEHFPDGEVRAVANGTIVWANLCRNTIYDDEIADSCDLYSVAGHEPGATASFGEHVVIRHGDVYVAYSHLAPGSVAELLLREKEPDWFDGVITDFAAPQALSALHGTGGETITVDQGDVLGLVGNSGKSDGAHLHFEVWPVGTERGEDGHARGLPARPPSVSYVPPATEFSQFNPFCALPEEVETEDGSYQILEKFPKDSDFGLEEAQDEDVDVTGDFEPSHSDRENCYYNFVMAYYNHNPSPERYGVCPNI